MPIKTITHIGARAKRAAAKAFLTYQIRSVDAELRGNHEAFPHIADPQVQAAMLARRDELSMKLCELRGEYRARYSKPGQVSIYGVA